MPLSFLGQNLPMAWEIFAHLPVKGGVIMAERVYLSARGDEANRIDVDAEEIRVVFNGESKWFRKRDIARVCLKNVWEPSALLAGVLMGVMGFLTLSASPGLGALLIAAGGLSFTLGMDWRRRLEIFFGYSYVYRLTFFYRGVRDIHGMLARHGYLKKPWWLFWDWRRPRRWR